MKKLIGLLACMTLFQGCSNDALPKYTVVQGLRVLALKADTPELNFDGATFTPATVDITPVVSDLYGAGRALKYSLEWCVDPGIAVGSTPTCVGNATRNIVAADQNVAATASFLAPNYFGSLTPVTVDFSAGSAATNVVLAQAFAAASATTLYNGANLLVTFELYPVADPSLKISSFKRIVFSSASKATKNSAPTGLEIRQNSVEITSLPSVESTLEAYLPAAQAESYFVMNSDGSLTAKTEVLETTWFLTGPEDLSCSKKKECTTDGLFSLSRTRLGEFNTFYVPQVATPTTRGRVLIGVARDDRGGITSTRYCTGTCP